MLDGEFNHSSDDKAADDQAEAPGLMRALLKRFGGRKGNPNRNGGGGKNSGATENVRFEGQFGGDRLGPALDASREFAALSSALGDVGLLRKRRS